MIKSALDIIKDTEQRNKAIIIQHKPLDIWPTVELHIDKFCESQKEFCEKAKAEGWLGYRIPKNQVGLLGYLRNGFAIQLRILNNYDIAVPIWDIKFVGFFRSSWFKNATLENGYVKPIYKKEHFEYLKKL